MGRCLSGTLPSAATAEHCRVKHSALCLLLCEGVHIKDLCCNHKIATLCFILALWLSLRHLPELKGDINLTERKYMQ